jgi:hypothetical protein
VREAAEFVRTVLAVFDGTSGMLPYEVGAALDRVRLREELLRYSGTYSTHFPVTFRKVLPDDALIAPTAGGEPYYALSFITYSRSPESFLGLASFLARSMSRLFEARLHWGKYFPPDAANAAAAYPGLAEFRTHCRQVDPKGIFRNEFAERVIFGE